jgi:hypothetical protein
MEKSQGTIYKQFGYILICSERGPCPCGYRHWVDGKVYDFVFHLDARAPQTAIGFNLGG